MRRIFGSLTLFIFLSATSISAQSEAQGGDALILEKQSKRSTQVHYILPGSEVVLVGKDKRRIKGYMEKVSGDSIFIGGRPYLISNQRSISGETYSGSNDGTRIGGTILTILSFGTLALLLGTIIAIAADTQEPALVIALLLILFSPILILQLLLGVLGLAILGIRKRRKHSMKNWSAKEGKSPAWVKEEASK